MQPAARRIGLIGGISWGATSDYYRAINLEVRRRLGGHHSADMLVRSLDMGPLLARANDVGHVSRVIGDAADALRLGGCEVLAIASFTGHRYAGALPEDPSFVDLLDVLGSHLATAADGSFAIWATSYALADDVLIGRLERIARRALLRPEPSTRERLDRVVFDELADQRLGEASLGWLQDLLERQVAAGARGLLLATTDLSPVVGRLRATVPVVDATALHAHAIVSRAFDA